MTDISLTTQINTFKIVPCILTNVKVTQEVYVLCHSMTCPHENYVNKDNFSHHEEWRLPVLILSFRFHCIWKKKLFKRSLKQTNLEWYNEVDSIKCEVAARFIYFNSISRVYVLCIISARTIHVHVQCIGESSWKVNLKR